MSRENLRKKWGAPSNGLSETWGGEEKLSDSAPIAPHKTMNVKARRKREWEKKNPPFTYRRFPRELRDRIRKEAETQNLNTGEFVRALLEFAIYALENAILLIDKKTSINRKLFSKKDGWSLENNFQWGLTGNSIVLEKNNEVPNDQEKLVSRQSTASYRIPKEMHHYLKQAAQGRNIDLGIFIVKLLSYSFEKYEKGEFLLKTSRNDEFFSEIGK